MRIGVLGLQGSVAEHCYSIENHGDDAFVVKYPEDLDRIDGLIIPGGESTTLMRLLKIKGMDKAISAKVKAGLPVWGTCAGLILLSKSVENNEFIPLGLIDLKARRNGYGNQHDSFTTDIEIGGNISCVRFIRAPQIVSLGEGVEVLAKYKENTVAAISNNVMVTTFHPEVTGDKYFYRYFRSIIEN